MAGVAGFGPTMRESKSRALPLGYTPILFNEQDARVKMGWDMGFEPMISSATN